MGRRTEVFGGVLVLGGVAAAHVPAGEAETQFDPGVACGQTLTTALGARPDSLSLIEVLAFHSHRILPPK
jgi:hypothetical protein